MKTGWVMEWEIQVKYVAPVRAELNRIAELYMPITKALHNLNLAAMKSTANLRGLFAVLPPKKFSRIEGE